MENPIKKLFAEIPMEDLREAVLEIKESDKTGYIKEDGLIRKYAKLTGELTGGFTATDFFMTTISILKEFSFRNVDNTEKIIRFTIKEWASHNEKAQPDHEQLIENWLKEDCKDWINKNY